MGRAMAIAAGWALAMAAGAAAAQGIAPAQNLWGTYAPGGDCTKEPRVTIGQSLIVQAGGKPTRYGPIDSCVSCVGGASYEGIEVWVTYLGANGDPMYPMFRVNADEKRGTLVVDRDASAPAPIKAVSAASPLKRCAR